MLNFIFQDILNSKERKMSQGRIIDVDIQEIQAQQSSNGHEPFHQQKNFTSPQRTPQPPKRHHVHRSFHPSTFRIIFGHLVSLLD